MAEKNSDMMGHFPRILEKMRAYLGVGELGPSSVQRDENSQQANISGFTHHQDQGSQTLPILSAAVMSGHSQPVVVSGVDFSPPHLLV